MLFTQVAFSALLLGAASANAINERFADDGFNALTKRQQFMPTTQTATGNTCADAFGDGYVTCREKTDSKNRLCYNPNVGQTCCAATWACPNGSFCLAEPFCCPNGEDPKTCAAENNISLPSSFTTPAAKPTTTTYSSKVSSTSASSVSYYVAPYPTAANVSTVVKATASGTGSYYAQPSQFTGAASNVGVSVASIAGVGLLGLLANLF